MKEKLLIAALGSMLAVPAAAAPETYVGDPNHSQVNFQVGHLGIAWIHGRFSKVSANITLDRAAKTGSIRAEFPVATVETGHAKRDELLVTEDYFNAAKFPTISFRSNSLRFKGDDPVAADGELTMLGVTKPVTIEITSFRCIAHPVNKRPLCGADVRAALYRSEFGMTKVSRSISDDIYINIVIEAFRK